VGIDVGLGVVAAVQAGVNTKASAIVGGGNLSSDELVIKESGIILLYFPSVGRSGGGKALRKMPACVRTGGKLGSRARATV